MVFFLLNVCGFHFPWNISPILILAFIWNGSRICANIRTLTYQFKWSRNVCQHFCVKLAYWTSAEMNQTTRFATSVPNQPESFVKGQQLKKESKYWVTSKWNVFPLAFKEKILTGKPVIVFTLSCINIPCLVDGRNWR